MSKPATNNNASKKALLQALEKNLGIVTTACKSVGLNRASFYRWYDLDKNFKANVDELSNVALDFVESQLFLNIKDRDTASIIFYLKTKGKQRGYVERQEITGGDGKDLYAGVIILPEKDPKP